MNGKTARVIRRYASKTGETPKSVKQKWVAMSPSKRHKERKRMAAEIE